MNADWGPDRWDEDAFLDQGRPIDAGYRQGGAHDRVPPARHHQAPDGGLLRAFANAVFRRYPDEVSAFHAFDLNGNGVISMSEFQASADSLRFQGDAASVFWELDTNRRGALGRSEFAMLRRFAPQAMALRPTPGPPPLRPPLEAPPPMKLVKQRASSASNVRSQAQNLHMPPAGIAIEKVGIEFGQRAPPPPGSGVANRRHRNAQQGTGVAEALDSWGEWRQWQEDANRSYVTDHDRPPYRQYRQHAWDTVPEGDPWDTPQRERRRFS